MNRYTYLLILLLFICCWSNSLHAQGILSGIVTKQNSGNEPIPGALVKAGLSNQTETGSKGDFSMTLPGKAPGYEVRISVESPGMEVVNKEKLQRYALRADQTVPLKIYLCPVGEWERNALTFYQINEKKITYRYRQRISQLKSALSDQQVLQDSLGTLAQQYQIALNQSEELANRFAIANLDDASRMFKQAYASYAKGEIDSALQVLDEVRLDELASGALQERAEADTLEQLVVAKRDTAAKTLAEVVQGYALRARMLITRFEFEDAFRNFEKAVSYDSLDFDLNFEYAYFLQEQNRFRPATAQYEKVLRLAEDSAQRALTLNNLGVAYRTQNDFVLAMPAYEEALKIYRKLSETNEAVYLSFVATTLNNLGIAHKAQNEYARGIPAYEEALKIFRKLTETNEAVYLPDVAGTLNNLGIAYKAQNDYARCIPAYEEALKIFRKLSETNEAVYLPFVATTLNNLGIVYRAQNDYARAMPAFEEALKIYRKLSATNEAVYLPFVATTLNNLGNALTAQNEYARGIPAYEEALKIRRKLSATNEAVYLPFVANTLNNLGIAYRAQNEYARCIPAYEEALKIRRKLSATNEAVYLPDVAGTLNNLGIALMDQNEYARCIPAYEEALKIYRKLSATNEAVYLSFVATTLNNLGVAFFQQNKRDEAQTYMQEAVDLRSRLASQQVAVYGVETASSLSVLGYIHHLAGKTSSRDRCWQEAQLWLDRSPETARRTQIQNILNSLKQAAAQPAQKEDDPLTNLLRAIQESPSYGEKVRLQQGLVVVLDQVLQEDPGNQAIRTLLSEQQGSLSWYTLFTQDFPLAESSARRALELDPETQFAYTKLAHALLFQGKFKAAKTLYLRFQGQSYDETRSWEEVFLADLDELEQAGITHPDVERIRKLLKK